MSDAGLQKLLEQLALARRNAASRKAALAERHAAWEAENAALIEYVQNDTVAVAALEAVTRQAIVERYEATGDSRPHPAVAIRVTRKLRYDAETALAWAKRHDIALQLNTKTFERVMRDNPERPDWCAVLNIPTATIATDLDAALESTS